jgi:hypothetical protein
MGSRLLEIQKVDHVIVGTPVAGRSGYFSFKEAGLISQKGKSAIWEKLGRRQQPEPKWVKTSLHSSETLFHRRYKLLVLASQLLSVVNVFPPPSTRSTADFRMDEQMKAHGHQDRAYENNVRPRRHLVGCLDESPFP